MAPTPLEQYQHILAEIFPIDLPYCSLRLHNEKKKSAQTRLLKSEHLEACFDYELFDAPSWGGPRNQRSIETFDLLLVRSQEIAEHPNRVEPYLRGWAAAVRDRLSLSYGLEYLQEHTLGADSLRRFRGPKTDEEFRCAILAYHYREWGIPGVPKRKNDVNFALGPNPITVQEIREILGTNCLNRDGHYRLTLADSPTAVSQDRKGIHLDMLLAQYNTTSPSKRNKPVTISPGKGLFLPTKTLANRRNVIAYISGWKSALSVFMEEEYSTIDQKGKWITRKFDISHTSPSDLVDISVLSTPGLTTAREYYQKFLSAGSLGRLMV